MKLLAITLLLTIFANTAMSHEKVKNILGTKLQSCCADPNDWFF